MRNLFFLAFALLVTSCEVLPDLNPNTSSGSEIEVFELEYTDFELNDEAILYAGIDLDDDGSNDFEALVDPPKISGCGAFCCFSEELSPFIKIKTNCELLQSVSSNPINLINPLYVSNLGGSFSIQIPNFWERKANIQNLLLQSCNNPGPLSSSCNCSNNFGYNVPQGISYFYLRFTSNGKQYYGWAEISTNESNYGITRIAFANQAGVQLRAGQTGF